MKDIVIYILGCILVIGGIYTFYSSTAVLFGWFGGAGRNVVFIKSAQICCLLSAFLYVISGILFFLRKKLSTSLLFIATIIMFVGYIGMLIHINGGNPVTLGYIGEMLARTTATMLFAAASWYIFTRTRFIYPSGHDAKSFRKLMKEYQAKKMREKI